MSLKIIEDKGNCLTIKLDNGDYKVLNEIVKKWKFKDRESVLRYSLALLDVSERGNLFKRDKDGSEIALNPSDQLING
ncbi:MAG: hypothetical protein WCG04_02395 [Alphaproteobacteria bacterium]